MKHLLEVVKAADKPHAQGGNAWNGAVIDSALWLRCQQRKKYLLPLQEKKHSSSLLSAHSCSHPVEDRAKWVTLSCAIPGQTNVMSTWRKHNMRFIATLSSFTSRCTRQDVPCESDEQKWNSWRRAVVDVVQLNCHTIAGQMRILLLRAFRLNWITHSTHFSELSCHTGTR